MEIYYRTPGILVASPCYPYSNVPFLATTTTSPRISSINKPISGQLVLPYSQSDTSGHRQLCCSTIGNVCSKKIPTREHSPNPRSIKQTTFCSNVMSDVKDRNWGSPFYTRLNPKTKRTPFFPKIDIDPILQHGQRELPSQYPAFYPPKVKVKNLPRSQPKETHSSNPPSEKSKVKCALKSKSKTSMILKAKNIRLKGAPKKQSIDRRLRKKIHKKNKALHKTELCSNWTLTATCRFKEKCYFAHGLDELVSRVRPGNFKTRPCVDFAMEGTQCQYGYRCHYCHPGQAVRRTTVSDRYIDKDYFRALEKKFGDNKYPFGIYV